MTGRSVQESFANIILLVILVIVFSIFFFQVFLIASVILAVVAAFKVASYLFQRPEEMFNTDRKLKDSVVKYLERK